MKFANQDTFLATISSEQPNGKNFSKIVWKRSLMNIEERKITESNNINEIKTSNPMISFKVKIYLSKSHQSTPKNILDTSSFQKWWKSALIKTNLSQSRYLHQFQSITITSCNNPKYFGIMSVNQIGSKVTSNKDSSGKNSFKVT